MIKKRLRNNSSGFTLIELMVVVAIIGILISIAALNYPKLLANLKKKACIANMRTIYGASQLALMENPSIPNLKLKILCDKGYLKTRPACPYGPKDGSTVSSSVFYAISDAVGKPLDIICVNKANSKNAHGSLRKILNMTDGDSNNSGNNSGGSEN